MPRAASILAMCMAGAKALSAGDCAFVAVFADEPSQFGLLLLKDVDETVFVTDHGMAADGSLSQVGSVTKQHAGKVPAGTVLKSSDFQGEGGVSGDHLVAFTGSKESPTLLCAVHMEEMAGGVASRMLSTLEDGVSAVTLPEADNAYYTGPAFGTVDELRAAINDRSLWTSENLRPEDGRILSSFVIQSGANTTTAVTQTTTFMANSTSMTTTATTMFETTVASTTMAPTTTMPPVVVATTAGATTSVGATEPTSSAVNMLAGFPLLAVLSIA
ncbi:unnamed protein product [Effrenium voratum]|nr:unnamed protein product [Effrenium voratum]